MGAKDVVSAIITPGIVGEMRKGYISIPQLVIGLLCIHVALFKSNGFVNHYTHSFLRCVHQFRG